MVMLRPSGETMKIAEKVVPGLQSFESNKKKRKRYRTSQFLSEVEAKQTRQIEKEGLNEKKKASGL